MACRVAGKLLDLLYGCVKLPTDTDLEASRKKIIIIGLLTMLVLNILLTPKVRQGTRDGFRIMYITYGLLMMTIFVPGTILLVTKQASKLCMTVFIVGMTVCIILADTGYSAGLRNRAWPLFVLVVDYLLILRLPAKWSGVVVVLAVVWLFITQLETLFRFGLYDIPGLPTYEQRIEKCSCAHPPCGFGFHMGEMSDFFTASFVFVIDFLVTRFFSQRMLEEKEKMQRSIDAADTIARALSRFDLQKAQGGLDGFSELPQGLRLALTTILNNLHRYRPYLPPAMFELDSPTEEDSGEMTALLEAPRKAPGLDKGQRPEVSIVHIKAHTGALWDEMPDVMPGSVHLFSKAVRRLTAVYNGYESRSIAEEFLVVFDTVVDAVAFAGDMHVALTALPWPEELLAHKTCEHDCFNLWGGLSAKVGIQHGPTTIYMNELTGQFAYAGPNVLLANRLSAGCPPGGTLVSNDVVASGALDDMLPVLSLTAMPNLDCNLLLPTELQGRADTLQSLTAMCAPGDFKPLDSIGLEFVPESSIISEPDSDSMPSIDVAQRLVSSDPATLSILKPVSPQCCSGFAQCSAATMGTLVMRIRHDVRAHPDTFAERLGRSLSFIMANVDRSHGAIVSLNGSSLLVSWNVFKRCESHIRSAMAFTATLSASAKSDEGDSSNSLKTPPVAKPGEFSATEMAGRAPSPTLRQNHAPKSKEVYADPSSDVQQAVGSCPGSSAGVGIRHKLVHDVSVGLSNGPVVYGRVGSVRQRFVTTVGFPVTLCIHLANAAQALGAKALLASAPDQPCPASLPQYRAVTRPVDRWKIMGESRTITVHQIDMSSLVQREGDGGSGDRSRWAWSDDYRHAFKNKDVGRLDAMASKDPVIDQVCDLLSSGRHLVPKPIDI